MYAQVRGNSQGLIKIPTGGVTRAPDHAPMTVTKETSLSALIDGHGSAGMLVMHRAMEMAAAKATEHGVGIVGTNGTSTSTGALSFFAEELGRRGLIALVISQSPEYVAPHGTRAESLSPGRPPAAMP